MFIICYSKLVHAGSCLTVLPFMTSILFYVIALIPLPLFNVDPPILDPVNLPPKESFKHFKCYNVEFPIPCIRFYKYLSFVYSTSLRSSKSISG